MNGSRILIGLTLLAAVIFAAALFIGPAHTTREILWTIRLPRVGLGFLVGMALACAGVILQSLLRNPLADPFVLGTSSGASFGVLISSMIHLHATLGVQSVAFIFALLTMMVVYRIARTGTRVPVPTLILAGVIVSTFLNSLVFLAFSLFYRESFSAIFFLLGSLANATPASAGTALIFILPAVLIACRYSRFLDVLSLGEETALALGVDPERLKRLFFGLSSLMVAAAVTSSGMIGFVGLTVPHLLRLILGPNHRQLLPAAALGGGTLLMVMDGIARTAAAPAEIPVGVIAAILGTPFFIYLLRRQQGGVF
jgi:iron complex transport system permease protein